MGQNSGCPVEKSECSTTGGQQVHVTQFRLYSLDNADYHEVSLTREMACLEVR